MRVIQSATHNAQEIQQQLFAKQMLQHEYLQKRAGGIDPEGADAALAVAIHTIREAYGKSIDEARAINKHFNLSSKERQKHALGQEELTKTIDVEINGEKVKVVRTFKKDNIFTREAAIADQMTTGTAYEAEQLVIASGSEDFMKHGFQTTVAEMMGKNPGMQAKMLHLGGQSIDDISQGLIGSKADVDWVAARALARGKLSQQDVTSLDPEGVKEFLAIARNEGGRTTVARARLNVDEQSTFDQRIRDFQKVVLDSFTGDARDQIKSGARDDLEKIARLYDPTFVDPAKR
jgi:hypothetical protein